jgi:hypothetical protein
LNIVAQKLVTIESLRAKTASGAIKAAQKFPKPVFVPNQKIEPSGKKTSGSIMNTSMPMLNGRAISKPRTCLIVGIYELISNCRLPIPVTVMQFRVQALACVTEPCADRGPRRGSPAGVVDAPDPGDHVE